MLGSRLFSRMTLRLVNGSQFAVLAKSNSPKNVYIQSATPERQAAQVSGHTAQRDRGGRLTEAGASNGGTTLLPAVAAQIVKRLAICGLRSPKDIGRVDA